LVEVLDGKFQFMIVLAVPPAEPITEAGSFDTIVHQEDATRGLKLPGGKNAPLNGHA
jgi:hypothetical protein